MKKIICFIVFTFTSILSFTQNDRIVGIIKDSSTTKPIEYAIINIEKSNISCISDSNGIFSIKIPDSLSMFILSVKYPGYQKYIYKYSTSNRRYDTLCIKMQSAGLWLDKPIIEVKW